jgi:hypothetical protein
MCAGRRLYLRRAGACALAALTATACIQSAFAQAPPGLGSPLYLFYSAKHENNLVVATAAGIAQAQSDPSYAFIALNGYVLGNDTGFQPAGTVSLNFYLCAASNHTITTASAEGNAWAVANNYSFVRQEGWVLPASAGTIDTAAVGGGVRAHSMGGVAQHAAGGHPVAAVRRPARVRVGLEPHGGNARNRRRHLVPHLGVGRQPVQPVDGRHGAGHDVWQLCRRQRDNRVCYH